MIFIFVTFSGQPVSAIKGPQLVKNGKDTVSITNLVQLKMLVPLKVGDTEITQQIKQETKKSNMKIELEDEDDGVQPMQT